MKKVGKYLTIVLLLLLGLLCIGVLYLFFIPGAALFNIQYISLNERIFSENYDASNISKIVLNTRAYETNIVEADNEEISVKVYTNNIGFVLTKNSKANIGVSIKNNCLTFDISEPYGATILNSSFIELRVPSTKEFDLSISNNSSYTNIKSGIQIDNFTYSTKSGDINLDTASISGELNLALHDANLTMCENLVMNENNVNMTISSGKFDASKHTLGEINVNENSKAVILLGNVEKLTAKFNSAGGRIEADTINSLDVESSDTNVYVGTINNTATIILTKSGMVEMENINGASYITTKDGDIKIGRSISPLTLESKNGDIIVSDCTSRVVVTNVYGDIYVKFNDNAPSHGFDSLSREIIAKNENGKITIIGADNVNITATKNSRIDLTMHDVLGTNSLVGANGSVYVNISDTAQYKLSTESSGKVSVNLSQISTVGQGGYTTGEYVETFVNGANGNTTNLFTITTQSGALTIRDFVTVNL